MICNKSKLADILGVTQTTLTMWQREGLPFATKRGRDNAYETSDVIDWLLKRERTKLSRAATESGGIDIDHEKARKERALADKHEMDLSLRRGELLEASDVERVWLSRITAAKTRLMGIPRKCAPAVVMVTAPADAEAIIEQEVRDALEELAKG
jgi:phage terminase Nu1 subunit (DNA packaging protein)